MDESRDQIQRVSASTRCEMQAEEAVNVVSLGWVVKSFNNYNISVRVSAMRGQRDNEKGLRSAP